jgi:hypothetical protein
MYINQARPVESRCWHETTLKVEAIDRVYHPSPPLESNRVVCTLETTHRVEPIYRVNYEVHLVNSRCLYETTAQVETILSIYTCSSGVGRTRGGAKQCGGAGE